ncbi:hypothetical protein Bhyg_08483 [Pseudolycoriella hygida]|uniref:Uncharacterized protein n=1 Tax=Pseudolycoriella hygida TaxID=35572 RepID=A0A9Q0N617_9DIPT|nr:hypothetical protein Bhyg_08483 [Pseudolycoriella hygida]
MYQIREEGGFSMLFETEELEERLRGPHYLPSRGLINVSTRVTWDSNTLPNVVHLTDIVEMDTVDGCLAYE